MATEELKAVFSLSEGQYGSGDGLVHFNKSLPAPLLTLYDAVWCHKRPYFHMVTLALSYLAQAMTFIITWLLAGIFMYGTE